MIDLTTPKIAFYEPCLARRAHLAVAIQEASAARNLTKEDRSPVTVADFTIQAVVAYRLRATFPGAVLVAEERAERLREEEQAEMLETIAAFTARFIPGATGEAVCDWIDEGAGEPGDRFWTLDPIDGTKGYRRGGHYATALALIEDGEVTCGGMSCPVGEDAYRTTGGGILAWPSAVVAWYAPWTNRRRPAAAVRLRAPTPPCCDASTNRDTPTWKNSGCRRLSIPVSTHGQLGKTPHGRRQAELLFRLLSTRLDYRECIWIRPPVL